MRFRFLDRVVSSEPEGGIVTEVTFPGSEDYVGAPFHNPGEVPATIVLEAMAASAGRLIEVVSRDRAVGLMIKVEEARFLAHVAGGDCMKVRSELIGMQDKSGQSVGLARTRGWASIGDKAVAEASIVYLCLPGKGFKP